MESGALKQVLDGMLCWWKGPVLLSVNKCVLVILVRQSRSVQAHCLARLPRERLGKLLEKFQFHPSCVRKIANIELYNYTGL